MTVTRQAQPAPPAWLEDFQVRFGEVLRTPLDRASGTLTAVPARYDARTVEEASDRANASAAERLAVYNRQGWFRFFDVIQSAFPLTCRLLGHWTLNGYAARYLHAHPPTGWDIDGVPDRFEAWFAAALSAEAHVDREALVEAARIDAAFRDVFRAPAVPTFRPSAEDAARLLDARLVPSPAVVILEEHRPLLELRRRLLGDAGEARVPLPPPAGRRAYAITRTNEGTVEVPLALREAELLRRLRDHSVREALALLEAACSPDERAELPANAHAWLARGVGLGFWIGLRCSD